MSEYPLVQNLDKIKNNINLNTKEKVESVKNILLEEVSHRRNEDSQGLVDSRFDVAYAVFGPKRNSITYALARLEAKYQFEYIFATSKNIDPEFRLAIFPNLLITYLENHKYYLGNDFFEVLYEVFGEKSDYIISVMHDQIQKNIARTMGKHYSYTTAEENKKSFAKHFQEKFKDTYFEMMVIQFTNDYVKNGECIPA